jgi:hypothetical protein
MTEDHAHDQEMSKSHSSFVTRDYQRQEQALDKPNQDRFVFTQHIISSLHELQYSDDLVAEQSHIHTHSLTYSSHLTHSPLYQAKPSC